MSQEVPGMTVAEFTQQVRMDCEHRSKIVIVLTRDDLKRINSVADEGASPYVVLVPYGTKEFDDGKDYCSAIRFRVVGSNDFV